MLSPKNEVHPIEAQQHHDAGLSKRQLGAYFTPPEVTEALCEWAIKLGTDDILEPSFGGCGFLEAAWSRLQKLEAINPKDSLFGCDIDPSAFLHLKQKLGVELPSKNYFLSDFLTLTPEAFGRSSFSVIVGNPPYVAHQNISKAQRGLAKAITEAANISGMNGRASLWGYFVLHSLQFLRIGGRLAYVLPRSFLDANYSVPIRKVISNSFRRSIAILVKDRLFLHEGTEERSVILLADERLSDEKSTESQGLYIAEVGDSAHLSKVISQWERNEPVGLRYEARAGYVVMPGSVQSAYTQLCRRPTCFSLGDFISVKIGVVTGANKFFVMEHSRASKWKIPEKDLHPIVSKFSHLSGADFSQTDYQKNKANGLATLLLHPLSLKKRCTPTRNYLATLPRELRSGNATFKKRKLWYQPDDGRTPDAFLSYMHHDGPRMCLNASEANCTNTIHRAYFLEPLPLYKKRLIVLSLMSTFSQLSAELEGRSYGSGVLKIEPSEAARIKLTLPTHLDRSEINDAFNKVNKLLRSNQDGKAKDLVDQLLFPEFKDKSILSQLKKELNRRRGIRQRNGDASE